MRLNIPQSLENKGKLKQLVDKLEFTKEDKFMGRDILFKTEEFVFSYRVGGLLMYIFVSKQI